MAFNQNGFMTTAFIERTATVAVPGLSEFFEKSEKPEWVVRGQTGVEVARAIDASVKIKNMSSILEAVGNTKMQIAELKNILGLSDDAPPEIIKRMEQLVDCSVSVKVDLPFAMRLAETKPNEFYLLTNKIIELTNSGMDIKKLKTSGETQQ